MQTFLPYPNYLSSALCLDKRRCWKQVIEARQIIFALSGQSVGWQHHPAVKMWQGFLPSLRSYHNTFLYVCRSKWKIAAKPHYFFFEGEPIEPDFIGNEAFHASHRSNLLRKDPDYYGELGWREPSDLPYIWRV